MARSRKARAKQAKQPFVDRDDTAAKPYHMLQSVSHDPQDFRHWQEMVKNITSKPTRNQIRHGGGNRTGSAGVCTSQRRQLTRGFLLPRDGLTEFEFYHTGSVDFETPNGLAGLLENTLIGSHILTYAFGNGWQNVQSLALTSKRTWRAVTINTKLWDVLAGKALDEAVQSPIFVAVAPEYSIGELMKAAAAEESTMGSGCPTASIVRRAQHCENKIYDTINSCLPRWQSPMPHWAESYDLEAALANITEEDRKHFPSRLIRLVGSLKSVPNRWKHNQLTAKTHHQLYEAPISYASMALEKMLVQIWNQKVGLEVLSFHKVPMLDIRVIAIILRACPHVSVLSIYDCPLIHFGNVIALLDLIWEVNKKRREVGKPLITTFDFYPRYEKGIPYDTGADTTYGLTWAPTRRDLIQSGFFAIVLKAYMKARTMKLDMFSQGASFLTFLKRVPNLPFAVPRFLDAVERYMQLPPSEGASSRRMRIYYDLLAPIRIVLNSEWRKDWPEWFMKNPTPQLVICTSCGYELPSEFFLKSYRVPNVTAADCICSGCHLQHYLESEPDHFKGPKQAAFRKLFTKWKGSVFNQECPIPSKGRCLIDLRTTREDLPPGPTFIPGHGQPDWQRPALRNHKQSQDSLQNLPSLSELVAHLVEGPTITPSSKNPRMAEDGGGESKAARPQSDDQSRQSQANLFPEFHSWSQMLDVYIRSVHLLREQYPRSTTSYPAFSIHRPDDGFADCMDEPQYATEAQVLSFNFQEARDFYLDIFPPNDPEWRRQREERREREFW